jgi:sugar lactone lactonase YvrE
MTTDNAFLFHVLQFRRREIMKKSTKLFVLLLLIPVLAAAQSGLVDSGVLAEDAKPVVIGEDFRFTEGPLWLPTKGMLIFADIPNNTQFAWKEGSEISVFRKPSGFANGSQLDNEGNIIVTQHDRTVLRITDDGEEVIASTFDGKKLNSPNDLTIHKDGSIYFSDPHYGIAGSGPEKAEEEQPCRGIYRLEPGGDLIRVGCELGTPNGLVFANDYSKLYVANSSDGNIYVYDVHEDGSLGNLRIFAVQPVPEGMRGIGDGIKIDKAGNIYAAAAEGVAVYSPAGELLGVIELHKAATNLCFGGEEMKTLFITARDKVYMIETLIGR